MTVVDLGINSTSIQYEVALEILGQERQPLMNAIRNEKAKPTPSAQIIQYFEARLAALDELQQNLRVADLSAIEQVLDPSNRLIRA